MTQPLWKIAWLFLTKLSILLKHDQAIVLILYFPQMVENVYAHKKSAYACLQQFYISVIHNFQKLKTTNMSFSRWIDKLWYIQAMEYY